MPDRPVAKNAGAIFCVVSRERVVSAGDAEIRLHNNRLIVGRTAVLSRQRLIGLNTAEAKLAYCES
jgi:hypothetical protein